MHINQRKVETTRVPTSIMRSLCHCHTSQSYAAVQGQRSKAKLNAESDQSETAKIKEICSPDMCKHNHSIGAASYVAIQTKTAKKQELEKSTIQKTVKANLCTPLLHCQISGISCRSRKGLRGNARAVILQRWIQSG